MVVSEWFLAVAKTKAMVVFQAIKRDKQKRSLLEFVRLNIGINTPKAFDSLARRITPGGRWY